jgi:DNA-binding transcriptional MerR regulator
MTASTRGIGEAAAQAGVSTRTLRYYEELGLLVPSARSPGGARRYSIADVQRLHRIRQLQELMGFNLDEIGEILAAEDELQRLREEFRAGQPPHRQEEIVARALELNAQLRAQVKAKQTNLQTFLTDLEDKARRYQDFADSLRAPTALPQD